MVSKIRLFEFGKLLKLVDAAGLETSPVLKTSYTYTNRELDE